MPAERLLRDVRRAVHGKAKVVRGDVVALAATRAPLRISIIRATESLFWETAAASVGTCLRGFKSFPDISKSYRRPECAYRDQRAGAVICCVCSSQPLRISPNQTEGTNVARNARLKTYDAISILKADHRKVESLFERYEKSTSKGAKGRLAHDICLELSVHTTIEEELFYPAIKNAIEEDLCDEAYVEHDSAKALIAEVMASRPGDDFYDAKVHVLSEMIKHHVKEEEQRGGMFAQAKKNSGVDLAELGLAMATRKKELTTRMKSAGVPTPATRSMKGASLQRSAPVA